MTTNGAHADPNGTVAARTALPTVVGRMVDSIRKQPGRPKKGDPKRPLSLSQLDRVSQEQGGEVPTVSRTTLYLWERGSVIPQPKKLAALLVQQGLTGARAVPYVGQFAAAWMQSQAARFTQDLAPALEAGPGEAVHLRIETEVKVT